ncbi:type VI secretion system tip protein VgrG, partial [Pseudomonas veronii]|nr:type VI secretion system tip protein VgrG [Pseudomonas veronii]
FSLTGFSRQDQNREYLIVGCRYYIVQESLESGGGSSSAQFDSSLTCIDAQQSFRPLANTYRPIVKGPQTALVVGPKSDSAATRYTIEAGDSIRLVCGDSVIELTADGAINLTCGSFNLFSSGSSKIQTQGKLDINQGSDEGTSPGQQGVRATIHNAVESTFADKPGAGQ